MIMRRLLTLCALLCLATALCALPALAQGDDDWGLIETTPADWPISLYLPDYGELVMVGYDGATREDVTEPFDFEWFYDAEEGSGDIYMIQGFFLPTTDDSPVWEEYDAAFSADLAETGVEILYSELEAQYGGHRWLLYGLLYPGSDGSDDVQMLTLLNFDYGLTFLNVFSDEPANEDLDAMLSLITGGPDAPQ